ncbi:MAG: HAMP domain-containing histidine kinase [Rhodospirillaceae bacterium]|nr:HAMP domain-containing histidine kinase [Rhodospirillaceae bacterium]MBT6135937.1 HAMP domain-containing histidine kinase [Rhodospirillaceae bacterium]
MSVFASLRARFLVIVALISLLALAAAGLVLIELFRGEVERQVESRLSGHLRELALFLEADAEGQPVLKDDPHDPRFARPYSGLYWQVTGSGGTLRSRSLWDHVLPLDGGLVKPGEFRQHRLAGPNSSSVHGLETAITLTGDERPYRLVVAVAVADLEGPVAEFRWIVVLAFNVVLIVLLVGSGIAVWLGLGPLDRLRDELVQIRAGESRRLAGVMPSELRPLVDDLNRLLVERDASIERARAQAGNLAHALKTPLAIIANEAADMARAGDAERAATVSEAARNAERSVTHHLARARAAALGGELGSVVALAPLAERLVRTVATLHSENPVKASCEIDASVTVRMDPEDLTEVLGNLVENAFVWAKTRIEVTATEVPQGGIVITIADDGPGLSPEEIERVSRRGERLDESSPGTGLGLSIARELVELYGGTLELRRSDLGGLAVSIRI